MENRLNLILAVYKESGNYEIEFDASEINSGVYFYSLFVGGERIETKRMIFF
ncbi:MAG: hypothetical protein R3A12_02590 [Ignavibacteria bacterium]